MNEHTDGAGTFEIITRDAEESIQARSTQELLEAGGRILDAVGMCGSYLFVDEQRQLKVMTFEAVISNPTVAYVQDTLTELVANDEDGDLRPRSLDILRNFVREAGRTSDHDEAACGNEPALGHPHDRGPSGAYDPETECAVRTRGGWFIFEDAQHNPGGTSYVRFVDHLGPEGVEIAYWTADEWVEDPEFVMGAICGSMLNAG